MAEFKVRLNAVYVTSETAFPEYVSYKNVVAKLNQTTTKYSYEHKTT